MAREASGTENDLSLTQLFHRFDVDRNGELDAEELTQVILELPHDLTVGYEELSALAASTVKMLGLASSGATITSEAFVRRFGVAAEINQKSETVSSSDLEIVQRELIGKSIAYGQVRVKLRSGDFAK